LKICRLILTITLLTAFFYTQQVSGQMTKKVLNLQWYDNVPYHFGFSLDVNQMFFTIKPTSDLQKIWYQGLKLPDFNADSARVLVLENLNTFGFTIGIVSNLRIGEYFDLRFVPDLAFGERDLIYKIQALTNGTEKEFKQTKKVYSTYVDFPLHIKYKSKRYNNARAYILAGMKYSLDLASEAKKNQDELDNKHVRLNKNDILADVGVGWDFYTTYFKFGVEIKMSYGLTNILVREQNIYTSSIDKLTSKIFQLSFTFE